MIGFYLELAKPQASRRWVSALSMELSYLLRSLVSMGPILRVQRRRPRTFHVNRSYFRRADKVSI
jgi:hypothetical protein